MPETIVQLFDHRSRAIHRALLRHLPLSSDWSERRDVTRFVSRRRHFEVDGRMWCYNGEKALPECNRYSRDRSDQFS